MGKDRGSTRIIPVAAEFISRADDAGGNDAANRLVSPMWHRAEPRLSLRGKIRQKNNEAGMEAAIW
ncbi:hypothetical protein [Sphingomonas lycopersici]|uniref:Uncharacterized protein n=1 Tax=Sphingomonas lycopersici TaxID=2951807 RepID=A0AA42CST9_9SPHN|nr:hypothetical protein [Sphingomonas lycopersici]MCW6533676.1 hypothetical protein [Sphingomonas lycopersici]